MNKYPITPDGIAKLKVELHNLKNVEVPQNIKDIEEARAHGDLKENAEYHAAKEKQSHLHARIAYLEDRIARADIIEPKKIKTEKIAFGATVSFENMDTGEQLVYKIVGEDESNPNEGTISITSPLAKALIGKTKGDEFEFKTSKGVREYAIENIEYK
ncbi:transcription elongation factor GreA [Myxococcota bacterium]|nr:transcription elongation factor GreA [Myxococcota bacterium]MBU1381506.1 transcription elongation factor GreA [Myxococcota bacterium]MBU1497513.1 transcription elongation factor GreA [Myxococcota bacterium]